MENKKSRLIGEFIRFGITGGLGTVTNLFIFFLLADFLGFSEIPVSIGCFIVAGTQNYFLNHLWSFREYTANTAPSPKKWAFFIGASLAGLTLNLFVMKAVLVFWAPPYKVIAQAAGIAAGMLVNFVISKQIVFKKKGANQ